MFRKPLRADKLTIQRLEDHQLFAGDISVDFNRGNLYVSGDHLDNRVEIRMLDSLVQIRSLDGGSTTVNGGPGQTFTGVLESLYVNLHGGDDYLFIHDVDINRDLSINLGLDRDNFTIMNAEIGDDLRIDWGSDPSSGRMEYGSIINATVGSSIRNNDLYVKGNEGNQRLYLRNVDVDDDLDILLTDDDDELDAVIFANVSVSGESGDARFKVNANTLEGSYLYNTVNSRGDIDLNYVGDLVLDEVHAADDIWIDGRNSSWQADNIRLGTSQAGDDIRIRGHAGDDTLVYAGEDDVALWGGHGHDQLFAGKGDDYLNGGSGNDSLMGWTGKDQLKGELGYDRVLRTPSEGFDTITTDALDIDVHFANGKMHYRRVSDTTALAKAGQWTADEVRRVDDALAVMVDRTGNNRLLMHPGKYRSGEITFIRQGDVVEKDDPDVVTNLLGWNDNGGQIAFVERLFADPEPSELRRTVYHEIGHNWDTEVDQWGSFLELSGWVENGTNWNPPGGGSSTMVQGTFNGVNSEWWYDSSISEGFARQYGQFRPVEDFATVFAMYFIEEEGSEWPLDVIGTLDLKVAYVEDLLDSISVPSSSSTPSFSAIAISRR